jgi:hypothetical protein
MEKAPDNRVGSQWRVQSRLGDERFVARNQGWFDELVVDHWLHIEWMNGRQWWARIGDAQLNIRILDDGTVDLTVERDVYVNRPEPRLAKVANGGEGSQEDDAEP